MRTNLRVEFKVWAWVLLLLLVLSIGTAVVSSQGEDDPEAPRPTPARPESDEPISGVYSLAAEPTNQGGYASKFSVVPGESLDFHISTSLSGPMNLEIYREGDTRQLMHTIENATAGQYSCAGMYETGCGWPVAVSFTVPTDWPSGAYTVDIPFLMGPIRHILFWVREATPGATGRILFLSSVNTYHAYNPYGGKSFYDYNSSYGVRSPVVSLDRPFQDLGLGQFYRWDAKFVRWAEAMGYPVAYATTYDLHFLPSLLTPYDVVVISGHSEYYSWEMRQRIKQYINNGGRLLNLSGNTMWRQVRYVDNGRTMIGYIPGILDPVQAQTTATGPNWEHPIYDVSFSITGAHWPFGGYSLDYGTENGGYWVQNSNHWVFGGTGIRENGVIGRTSNPAEMAIHDYEADGMPFNCAADGSTVLGPVGNTGTPHNYTVLGIAPVNYPTKGMYNIASMGIYTVEGGGAVFSANTTGWVRALDDPTVSRVTSNVLDRFLQGNIPPEPTKADADFLFYDRFNCTNLHQNRFSETRWLPTIHRFNYFNATQTEANGLDNSCGVDGAGLRMALGNVRNGMSYQSMLKPNFGSVNSVANSMVLNLSNVTLSEGSSLDLVQYYDDRRLVAPEAKAVLQLGQRSGQTVMRFQPAGANLPWRVVPSSGFFTVATWWDQPANQVVLWIDDAVHAETVDLSAFPAFNRADLGMKAAIGSNGGSLCLDELKFDDQLLNQAPIPTPGPTPVNTATATPIQPGSCASDPANILYNAGFEEGTANWAYYNSGSGSFTLSNPAYQCETAAQLNFTQVGTNMQFFQNNFSLKANTQYRLSFAAYSNSGHDLRLLLHQQSSPYTNYGIDSLLFDLGTTWQTFSTEFTTSGFSGTTNDVRLRFWFTGQAQNGDSYWIDDVRLEEVALSPTATATDPSAATATPTAIPPTATVATQNNPTATPTPVNSATPTDAAPAPTATNTPLPPTATNTALPPTATPTPIGSCTPDVGNVFSNPGFEEGAAGWAFYSSGSGSYTISSQAFQCDLAARLNFVQVGTNMQFFQSGFPIKADTLYRLSFAAYSDSGHDLRVLLHKQTVPYNSYGLDNELFDLGTSWQTFSTEFNTSGFSGTTSDVRLRFWFTGQAQNGDNYWIDDVRLEEVITLPTATNTPLPPTATNTPLPPTATNTPLPPTATNTPLPPTATNTPLPPTATNTPLPPTPTNTPLPIESDRVFVSSNSGGTINGIVFADEDILSYDVGSGTWSLYFDGSDVGLGASSSSDVDGFYLMSDGSILLSFVGAPAIPDVGSVDDSDIVRFVPTSLGHTTAGSFEYYFDGSDVELTTSGEDVDAIGLAPDGRLLISTNGGSAVTGAGSNHDEDILAFEAAQLGDTTSGIWSLYFDGRDVGLSGVGDEDVWGLWVDNATADVYLTTRGAFDTGVLAGSKADIFTCTPSSLGGRTICSLSAYFDGVAAGIGLEQIDGISIQKP